jgi:hypothetical protein
MEAILTYIARSFSNKQTQSLCFFNLEDNPFYVEIRYGLGLEKQRITVFRLEELTVHRILNLLDYGTDLSAGTTGSWGSLLA